jgi:hypothetical protein
VFHLGAIGWILQTPPLSKWHGTGLIPFTLTPVLSHLLTLTLIFYFVGGRHGELLVDQLRLLSTHDRRSKVLVRKVVPTLTSKSAEIYLSMASAKKHNDTGLSGSGHGPYVQQGYPWGTILCCTVVLAEGS